MFSRMHARPSTMSINHNLFGFLALAAFLAWLLQTPVGRAVEAFQQAATPTPAEQELVISSPMGGEALKGVVAITGTASAVNFVAYEVAFGYQADPTQTWFLVGQDSRPVTQGTLASWDTTTITDGNYRLRVQLFLSSGQVIEHILDGLRVRNYSLVETSTPAPTGQVVQERATPTPTNTPLPDFAPPSRTPAPQATNALQVTVADLASSAGMGMALAVAAVTLGVLYLVLKALFRR